METNITNGYIQPRYYQIAKDKIDAKQAMEPLAIVNGRGPVVGFDIPTINADGNFELLSSSSSANKVLAESFKKFNTPMLNKLSVDNINGEILNAHITASGLLSIDPVELKFDGVSLIGNNLENSITFVAVKSTLIQPSADIPISIPPNATNFSAHIITNWVEDGESMNAAILLGLPFDELLTKLSNQGFTLNHGTDTFIGLYQFGTTPEVLEKWKYYYNYYGNIIPMVPYGYNWPCNTPYNYTHQMSFMELVDRAILDSVNTDDIANGAITNSKLANDSVTKDKIVDGAVTRNKLGNNSVSTEKIVDKSVTGDKVADNSIGFEKLLNPTLGPGKLISLVIPSSNYEPIKILYPFDVTEISLLPVSIEQEDIEYGAGTLDSPVAKGTLVIKTKEVEGYQFRLSLLSFSVTPSYVLPQDKPSGEDTRLPPSAGGSAYNSTPSEIRIAFQIVSTGKGLTSSDINPWSVNILFFIEETKI